MPQVAKSRGVEIRRTYEDAGYSRDAFAALAEQPPKKITDATCGGYIARWRAAKIAQALNRVQSEVRWTADRVFEPDAAESTRPKDNRPPKVPGPPRAMRGAA